MPWLSSGSLRAQLSSQGRRKRGTCIGVHSYVSDIRLGCRECIVVRRLTEPCFRSAKSDPQTDVERRCIARNGDELIVALCLEDDGPYRFCNQTAALMNLRTGEIK